MSYTKHNYTSGSKLYASQLNEMDTQIRRSDIDINGRTESVTETLTWVHGLINTSTGVVSTHDTRWVTDAFVFEDLTSLEATGSSWGIRICLYDKDSAFIGTIPTNRDSMMWSVADIATHISTYGVNPNVKYARIMSYNANKPDVTIKRVERDYSISNKMDALQSVIDVGWRVGEFKVATGLYNASATSKKASFCRYPYNKNAHITMTGNNGLRIMMYDASGNYLGAITSSGYSWNQSDVDSNIANNMVDDCAYVAFHTYNINDVTVTIEYYDADEIKEISEEVSAVKDSSFNAFDPYKAGAFFIDHTFINQSGNDVDIPNQSIFNIESAKRLGFKAIEINVNATSDGYIAAHGASKKFGNCFSHVDGTTDISDTTFASVTTEWVKTNVRYTSKNAQYRIAPLTLQEALRACRTAGLIPVVQIGSDSVMEICDEIMGTANYIAYTYNENRGKIKAPIVVYKSAESVDDILETCRHYGKPFYYCLSNPASFTNDQLAEIAEAVHAEGFRITIAGCYLNESKVQNCLMAGFDGSSSDSNVNYFDNGNLANAVADMGDFSEFTVSGGTVTNGVLVMTNGNTVKLPNAIPSVKLGKACLSVVYKGRLKVGMGKTSSAFGFDNDQPMLRRFSTYYVNQVPDFLITTSTGCEIYSIKFACSRV